MIKGNTVYCDDCPPGDRKYAVRPVEGVDCCEAHAVKREKWLDDRPSLKTANDHRKGSGR